MKHETYFKKHGCIYGISYKYDFGSWSGYSAHDMVRVMGTDYFGDPVSRLEMMR